MIMMSVQSNWPARLFARIKGVSFGFCGTAGPYLSPLTGCHKLQA
jgi:hypothetical protein